VVALNSTGKFYFQLDKADKTSVSMLAVSIFFILAFCAGAYILGGIYDYEMEKDNAEKE